MGNRRRSGFRAGLELELELSEELSRMAVPHELTRGTKENISQRVDLKILPPPHAKHEPTFEMQLTLRRDNHRKMTDFAVAALSTTKRGVRVYIEIIASRHQSISRIAVRVAWAIKDIVRRFRNFGEHRLFGVRVNIGRSRRNPPTQRFSLMELVGDRVLHALRKEQRRRQTRVRELIERARAAKRAIFPQRSPRLIVRSIPITAPQNRHQQHRGFIPIRQPR